MRIIFAGSPPLALPSLYRAAEEHQICAVLTQPDRVAGRGKRLHQSPVKRGALDLGLQVLQPDRLGSASREAVKALDPELLVAVAYGRIFGPKFLEIFPRGGINLHPSLLPAFRGTSPIQAVILAGEPFSGVTIQRLALEMDSGDVLLQKKIDLDGSETAGSLTDTLSHIGAELLGETLEVIQKNSEHGLAQDHDAATYCKLIRKEDGKIDWKSGASDIERTIRAYNPWPTAFTKYGGKQLSILRASVSGLQPTGRDRVPGKVVGVDKEEGILIQTGTQVLAVQEVRPQARKNLEWRSFMNGARDFVGAVLGDE